MSVPSTVLSQYPSGIHHSHCKRGLLCSKDNFVFSCRAVGLRRAPRARAPSSAAVGNCFVYNRFHVIHLEVYLYFHPSHNCCTMLVWYGVMDVTHHYVTHAASQCMQPQACEAWGDIRHWYCHSLLCSLATYWLSWTINTLPAVEYTCTACK